MNNATQDLIRNYEFEHHAICAANPDWGCSLFDFLRGRNIDYDDIAEYVRGYFEDREKRGEINAAKGNE